MHLQIAQPLAGLVAECEVVCLAACCGLDAFDFDSEQMIPWVCEQPIRRLWEVLDQFAGLVCEIARHDGSVTSLDCNASWVTATECVAFLRVLQSQAVRAIEVATGQSLTVDPSWLTSTVVELARGIYDDRAFDRLPILADALQDAGCDNDSVLNHCRDAGPHARGCWVVDLLLGKA